MTDEPKDDTMPDEELPVSQLRVEVQELKAGTHGLATQVENLSYALTAIGALQERQTQIEKAAKTAVTLAEGQADRITELDSVLVPRSEHEERERVRTAFEQHRRRQLMRRVLEIVAGVLVLFVCVSYALLDYSRSKQNATYQVCVVRNRQSQMFVTYVQNRQQVFNTVTAFTPQQRADLAAASAQFAASFPALHCDGLK